MTLVIIDGTAPQYSLNLYMDKEKYLNEIDEIAEDLGSPAAIEEHSKILLSSLKHLSDKPQSATYSESVL